MYVNLQTAFKNFIKIKTLEEQTREKQFLKELADHFNTLSK